MTRQLFGTDGMRGRAGEFPLDPPTLRRAGFGLARLFGKSPLVVIGNDTRESCAEIVAHVTEGLVAAGAEVHYAGVVPTPGVAYLARRLGAAAGVVISASHNPYYDNGIKIFSGDGFKLPDARELALERFILGDERVATGTAVPPPQVEAALDATYADFLASCAPQGQPLRGLSIVLDCANGAAFELGPELFTRLGATVHPRAIAPDGRNINEGCGALHPQAMAAEVLARGAHLGIAFDGDADRCIFADENGAIRDGDDVLFVWGRALAERGELTGNTVVATTMSNVGLEMAFGQLGIALARADVGDKYVLERMRKDGAVLGGEQSGHVIHLGLTTTGDGLLTAVVVAAMTAMTAAAGGSLARLCAGWERLPQVLKSAAVPRKQPLDSLPRARAVYREIEERLGGRGRIVARYSGTEEKVRIMIEGEEQAALEVWAEEYLQALLADLGDSAA